MSAVWYQYSQENKRSNIFYSIAPTHIHCSAINTKRFFFTTATECQQSSIESLKLDSFKENLDCKESTNTNVLVEGKMQSTYIEKKARVRQLNIIYLASNFVINYV